MFGVAKWSRPNHTNISHNTSQHFTYAVIKRIYGLYYIITKIIKLRKEDGKKNAGKIFGLVIAILLVFGISFIFFGNIISIIKNN